MSNAYLDAIPKHFRNCEGKPSKESKIIMHAYMGYSYGESPEKQLKRLLKGEDYEQQKESEDVKRRLLKARVHAIIRDID